MAKNSYTVVYLPSFEVELDETLYYITYKLKNKSAAEKLLNNVKEAIITRSVNPEGFEEYKSVNKRKYKWYRIYVRNYTIFYTIEKNVMIVAHILYSKRKIEDGLRNLAYIGHATPYLLDFCIGMPEGKELICLVCIGCVSAQRQHARGLLVRIDVLDDRCHLR